VRSDRSFTCQGSRDGVGGQAQAGGRRRRVTRGDGSGREAAASKCIAVGSWRPAEQHMQFALAKHEVDASVQHDPCTLASPTAHSATSSARQARGGYSESRLSRGGGVLWSSRCPGIHSCYLCPGPRRAAWSDVTQQKETRMRSEPWHWHHGRGRRSCTYRADPRAMAAMQER
jgi:hypothetical protein